MLYHSAIEESPQLQAHFDHMIKKLEGSISGSVRSLMIAVIVCFCCTMASILVLVVLGVYTAYKTEALCVDVEQEYGR